MNLENQAFQGNQISVRLTDDRLQELNQLYAEAIGEPGSTVKQSFERVLDLAFNNVKKIDRPETLARVADLEAELKQVKADLEAERLRISTFEGIESDTVAELRQQLEEMIRERDEALNSANANAMIAQQITLDDESTIKITDIVALNIVRCMTISQDLSDPKVKHSNSESAALIINAMVRGKKIDTSNPLWLKAKEMLKTQTK